MFAGVLRNDGDILVGRRVEKRRRHPLSDDDRKCLTIEEFIRGVLRGGESLRRVMTGGEVFLASKVNPGSLITSHNIYYVKSNIGFRDAM